MWIFIKRKEVTHTKESKANLTQHKKFF